MTTNPTVKRFEVRLSSKIKAWAQAEEEKKAAEKEVTQLSKANDTTPSTTTKTKKKKKQVSNADLKTAEGRLKKAEATLAKLKEEALVTETTAKDKTKEKYQAKLTVITVIGFVAGNLPLLDREEDGVVPGKLFQELTKASFDAAALNPQFIHYFCPAEYQPPVSVSILFCHAIFY
jgi:hypothetical protein